MVIKFIPVLLITYPALVERGTILFYVWTQSLALVEDRTVSFLILSLKV